MSSLCFFRTTKKGITNSKCLKQFYGISAFEANQLSVFPEYSSSKQFRETGKYDRALPLIERTYEIMKGAVGPNSRLVSHIALEIVDLNMKRGSFSNIDSLFEKYSLFESADFQTKCIAYQLNSLNKLYQGKIEFALSDSSTAVDLAESQENQENGDPSLLFRSYSIHGLCQLYSGNFEEAEAFLQMAARWINGKAESSPTPSSDSQLSDLSNLPISLNSLGLCHYLKAEKELREAERIWRETRPRERETLPQSPQGQSTHPSPSISPSPSPTPSSEPLTIRVDRVERGSGKRVEGDKKVEETPEGQSSVQANEKIAQLLPLRSNFLSSTSSSIHPHYTLLQDLSTASSSPSEPLSALVPNLLSVRTSLETALGYWKEGISLATQNPYLSSSFPAMCGPGQNISLPPSSSPSSSSSSPSQQSGEDLLTDRLKDVSFSVAYSTLLLNSAEADLLSLSLLPLPDTPQSEEKKAQETRLMLNHIEQVDSALKALSLTQSHLQSLSTPPPDLPSQSLPLSAALARALTSHACLSSFWHQQPVTGEGLFRSGLSQLSSPSNSSSDPRIAHEHAHLQAAYGRLLSHWTRREKEGNSLISSAEEEADRLPRMGESEAVLTQMVLFPRLDN